MDDQSVVTEEMFHQAVDYSQPLREDGQLYGGVPYTHIVCINPDGEHFQRGILNGEIPSDATEVTVKTFRLADMTHRTGKPSGHVIHRTRWMMKSGEPRDARAAAVTEDGLTVAVGGMNADQAETQAWIIFNMIVDLVLRQE